MKYEISLELSAAPEGVVEYRIDDTHCNPKAVWEETDICYRDGKLILTGTLNVNDVHCYQINV